MDWKKDNIKKRYIDSITDDEAYKIAYLALGKPDDFEILKIERYVNGNNIPHVKIYCKYFETITMEYIEILIGIFNNLDTYSDRFDSVYCQKEIFEQYSIMGFD